MYYGRIINSTIYNALINTGVSAGQLSYSYTSTQGGATFPQIFAVNAVRHAQTQPRVSSTRDSRTRWSMNPILSIQHEFGKSVVLSLNYLGSFGRELPDFVDTNLPTPTAR